MKTSTRMKGSLLGWMLCLSLIAFPAWADKKLAGDRVKGDFSVMVLGSGGPMATASNRASAGYLIFLDGVPRILMDVGGGTFARLAESGVNIKDLDIVLLSHLHIDHTGDLSAMLKTLYFHNRGTNLAQGTFPPGRTAPVRIFGPDENGIPFPPVLGADPGVPQYPASSDYVHDHYDLNTGTERYLNIFTRAISGGIFNVTAQDVSPDWTAYNPETLIDEGDLRITAVGVNHGPVPGLAFRIDYRDRSIVYSGDTSSRGDNMINLSEGADLLIYDTAITDTLPDGPNDQVFFQLHTTPTRLGEVAATAGVRRLLLSHLTPITEPRMNEVRHVIRGQGYRGRMEAAEDLQVINLDRGHRRHQDLLSERDAD